MFDLDALDDHSLLEIAASRGPSGGIRGDELSSDPENWSDRVIMSLLAERLSQHLDNVKVVGAAPSAPLI